MAKIVVYEDSETDAVSRYAALTREHDVHLRFVKGTLYYDFDDPDDSDEISLADLRLNAVIGAGFKESQIHGTMGPLSGEEADLYFTDGLDGLGSFILERLPRERSFMVTGSERLVAMAERKGHNLVTGSVEDFVKTFLHQ